MGVLLGSQKNYRHEDASRANDRIWDISFHQQSLEFFETDCEGIDREK